MATAPAMNSQTLLRTLGARWELARRSTNPSDRAHTEDAVRASYRAAGFNTPERIVWCSSPVEIEQSRKSSWHKDDPGPLLKEQLIDRVLAEAREFVINGPMATVRSQVEAAITTMTAMNKSAELNIALDAYARDISWSLASRASRFRAWIDGRRPTHHRSFAKSRWYPSESRGHLAVVSYLAETPASMPGLKKFSWLQTIAENVSAIVPHSRTCWLGERPRVMAVDESGRLHSGSGPAVKFSDGWSLCAWKGTIVPAPFIKQRADITYEQIDHEANPVYRRCLIDLMTPQKFIATGWVARRAIDKNGFLWRKHWLDGDRWTAVEVVNGTAEPDGSFKHYFLQVPPDVRDPTGAIAWTYGMSTEQYRMLTQRT